MPEHNKGRTPRPLSRELIVRTAIAFVDERGLAALTMRALGERLGVEAMAIYHHVNGREDLLDAVADELVTGIRLDPEQELGPADGWQAYVHQLAHSARSLATSHPLAFPLVATRHPAAPWLRPPLRSLGVVEDFLAAMRARGLDNKAAVHVYKVFTSFLLGHLLLEVAEAGASTAPVEEPLDEGDARIPQEGADLDLAEFPTVVDMSALLKQNDAQLQFQQALEAVLDRLDLELSQ
jgi:TetR/AcrR family tetracycline transcriptional repressor